MRDFSFDPGTGTLNEVKFDRFGKSTIPDVLVRSVHFSGHVMLVSWRNLTGITYLRESECPRSWLYQSPAVDPHRLLDHQLATIAARSVYSRCQLKTSSA